MKKIMFLLVLALLSATLVYTVNSMPSLTPSVETIESCDTTYRNETENVYDYVTKFRATNTTCEKGNAIFCENRTEPYQSYEKVGSRVVVKNNTKCVDKKYRVSVNNEVKEIDFGDEWACINKEENSCLIVECVHKNDGAHLGQYTDCGPGKTCQRFEFCGSVLKTLFKNSRADFTEDDPTFYAKELAVEVAK